MENRVSILIVEEDQIQSEALKILLTKLHYNVVGITNTGEEAIELSRQIEPDIILMDITLEGELDGIETAIKIHESLDNIIIYLTGRVDNETRIRADKTRHKGYLIKPVNKHVLSKTLANCLT